MPPFEDKIVLVELFDVPTRLLPFSQHNETVLTDSDKLFSLGGDRRVFFVVVVMVLLMELGEQDKGDDDEDDDDEDKEMPEYW